MSRIIKEGKLPTYRAKCAVCGCEFEYTEQDVMRIYHPNGYNIDADLRMAYNNYIFCPCCDRLVMMLPQIPSEKAANPDFMEDVKALAAQYGLKIDNIEVSNNN